MHTIYEKKVLRRKTIVGTHLAKPSLEMIAGVMGIIKSGAAYMPIDPVYPADRIKYMLEDSKSSILLLNKDLKEKAEKFTGSIIEYGG